MLLFFACKPKQQIVESVPVQKPEKEMFPVREIARGIQSEIEKSSQSDMLSAYLPFNFEPVWQTDSLIQKGINWLKDSRYHGLNPDDFDVATIESDFKKLRNDSIGFSDRYARLDLLLTQSIHECGYQIRFSRINPTSVEPSWNFPQPEALPHDSIWIKKIKGGEIAYLNDFFEPDHPLYSKLKKELKTLYNTPDYRYADEVQYPGFNLQIGDSNQYVIAVKRRLLHIHPDSAVSMAFDQHLKRAVQDFQRKHKLSPDGIAGKKTYFYLNQDKERYITSVKVNMERLRWLPDHFLQQGVVVNIPSQELHLYQENKTLFSTKTVVGKYKNQTPPMYSRINYLVFNPCWTVPKSIATTSILRGIKRDSSFLQKRNMFLCKNGVEVPIDGIDFSAYTSNYFPFQVFQRTNPGNALGRVKFMFPNKYSIYLHDTPQQHLFNKDVRTFSHGCIRIQNALKMAGIILHQVDRQNTPLDKYLSKGFPVKVYLKKSIPVKVVYLTCQEDAKTGSITYERDVYMKDHKLLEKLNSKGNLIQNRP